LERQHGDGGPAYTAGQIHRLALEGDGAGFGLWKKVAARLAQLGRDMPPLDRA